MKIQGLLVCAVAVMFMFASPAQADLLAELKADEKYTTLFQFLGQTNLTDALGAAVRKYGSVTIFAPNNAAFTKALDNIYSLKCFDFSTANGTQQLKDILLYHVVIGKFTSFNDGQKIDTLLNNTKLNVSIVNGIITPQKYIQVNAANYIEDNQGVVHGINGILIPPQIKVPKCETPSPVAAPSIAPAVAVVNVTDTFAPRAGPTPAPTDSASSLMIGSGVLGLLVASFMLLL